MKMSKYNFNTYDHEGNLIMYNFLTGIPSLTKIMKRDVKNFEQIFLTNKEISFTTCNRFIEIVNILVKLGILVDNDIDENILFDAKLYSEIYDSKLTLTIFPTGKCNFKCPYCFETPQSFNREAMSNESQNTLLKYVQKNIPNHRALHVSWFGGEPLLSPEVIKRLSDKFVQICNARYLPYSADITTNGYFLDLDMFDMLYKLKVYDYMITVDGPREQHDKRRFTCDGKGSYDSIIGNLLRIRDNKQYKFANIMIRINMSRGFLEILDDFLQFLDSTFADDPRFKFMFVPVVKFSGSKFSNNNIYDDQKELFSKLSKNDIYINKLNYNELKINSIVSCQKCTAALKNSYVITPDLNVYKCNAHYDFNVNKIGRIGPKGDLVLDETLHRRWYLTSRLVRKIPETCNNCFYLPCCRNVNSGCPVSYLKKTQGVTSCPIQDTEQKKHIVETIHYAANRYSCTILNL